MIFRKEKGYIPFPLIACRQILTLKDRNRRTSVCRECYDFYSYFLMQNGHLSEYVFVYILRNLEENKSELKEHICMQPLLQALSGHKVVVVSLYRGSVHRKVMQLGSAIQMSQDKSQQSNFSPKLVLTSFQCNSFLALQPYIETYLFLLDDQQLTQFCSVNQQNKTSVLKLGFKLVARCWQWEGVQGWPL